MGTVRIGMLLLLRRKHRIDSVINRGRVQMYFLWCSTSCLIRKRFRRECRDANLAGTVPCWRRGVLQCTLVIYMLLLLLVLPIILLLLLGLHVRLLERRVRSLLLLLGRCIRLLLLLLRWRVRLLLLLRWRVRLLLLRCVRLLLGRRVLLLLWVGWHVLLPRRQGCASHSPVNWRE